MQYPSVPLVIRKRLLPTDPQGVPPTVVSSFRSFCESELEVEVGYICLVAIEHDGAEAEKKLELAVKLARPVDGFEEVDQVLRALGRRWAAVRPDVVREAGLAVLADRAMPAWAGKALQVFP